MNKPAQIGAGVAGVAVADMTRTEEPPYSSERCFLIATATFVVSNALIAPILGSHTFLAAVADHSQLMIAAGLIALIDGVAVLGIAAVLYPILKRPHLALAFGYGACGPRNSPRWRSLCSARSWRPVRTPPADLALRERIHRERRPSLMTECSAQVSQL